MKKKKEKFYDEFDEYSDEVDTNTAKKSKSFVKKITLVVVAVILVAVVGLVCWVVFYKPSNGNINDLPFDISGHSEETTADGSKSNSGITAIKHKSSYNFLVMGHDRAANLTDVMMLINYNMDTGSLTILQMPRDTYIERDGSVQKMNSLYSGFYGDAVRSGSKSPELEATRGVATVLEKSMCIKVHYTAVMDLDGFASIVDAIGGVNMYVPYNMYYSDPKQGLYINIKQGQQTLDGKKAEQFVRFRSGYVQADIGRGNAQKMFMSAFIEQLKNSISITNVSLISNLANTVADNVYTDMTVADIISFAKSALKIDLANVKMITLPGSPKYCDGQSYYIANRTLLLSIVNSGYNIYNADITETMFDKELIFTNEKNSEVNAVYRADPENVLDYEYNAQEIIDNPIEIPLQ